MAMGFWSYDWEYWNLFHKVTFDAQNKLILVNENVLELDWKTDVYSAWKEWIRLSNHIENPGVLPAIRVVGGDDITADGSRRVGATFFLTNGWRLKPWGGDYRLQIFGNVYTEEGDPIYVPVDGDYKIVIEQTLSSLVELVRVESSGAGSSFTVDDIASAVWDKASMDSMGTGTFGLLVNMIKAGSDLQIAQTLQIQSSLTSVSDLIQTLLKYEKNRTRVDKIQKKLFVYDDDGVTVLRSFDLHDFNGAPSITEIAERIPAI